MSKEDKILQDEEEKIEEAIEAPKTSKELGEEKLANILKNAPLLKKFATFEVDEAGNINIKPEFELDDFDIAFEDYFYEKHHPEVEDSYLIGQFFSKIYTAAAIKCNEGGGVYTIDCWKNRYTARKVADIEKIHYESMTDEEKAKYDADKKKNDLENEKSALNGKLRSIDYIGVKIATGRATIEEYAEQIEKMKSYAQRINEIDKELEAM